MRRLLAQDLAWGMLILLAAAGLGLMAHWSLVRQGFQGDLPARLEQWREQYRQSAFPEIQTINLTQAYALHRQGQAVFVDARPHSEYTELHIAGAVNLNADRLKRQGGDTLPVTDRQRPIVVYCGQKNCDASLEVAEFLQAQGFNNIMAFLEGFRAWDEAGYPVDIGY
ncbi:MAG: rhodanese-like domain-containing protein [Desulfobacteraceae bacterium]